jgi:hypothetical protein
MGLFHDEQALLKGQSGSLGTETVNDAIEREGGRLLSKTTQALISFPGMPLIQW